MLGLTAGVLASGLRARLNWRICSARVLLPVAAARVFLEVAVREGVFMSSAMGALSSDVMGRGTTHRRPWASTFSR